MDAAFDGSRGNIHDPGNFLVLVALQVEPERDLGNCRQHMDGFLHFFVTQPAFGRVAGGRTLIFLEPSLAGLEDLFSPGSPAIPVDKDIAHNGEQPGLDIGAFTELVPVGQGPVYRVLQEVLRFFHVFGKIDCEVIHPVRMTDQKLVELYR